MTKLIAILGGAVLLGTGIAAVQFAGSSDPAGAAGMTTAGETATTAATTGASSATTTAETTTVKAGEDISGPCDEAEHADDPRCARGTASGGDDVRSGHGGGDHDDHDDDDDDRSGSNSGRG